MPTHGSNSILKVEPEASTAAHLEELAVSGAVPDTTMYRRLIGLFAANMLTIVVVGVSFLVYSRILTPPEFGLYAVAFSLATLLALILDGGLKTTIIKHEVDLQGDEESSIAILMMFVSAALILTLAVAVQPLLALRPSVTHDARFVLLFVGVALSFYPFVTLPTAKLERGLKYEHIAWIESLSTIVERGAPALLLIFTKAGVYSFIWALLLSRILRTAILAKFHPIRLRAATWSGFLKSVKHLREGAWIQTGTISSVIRDNLHTLLIAPLFGITWVGYYAWALHVCLVSSQVFAQISARVSLPLFAQARNFESRWPRYLHQIRMLTMLTVPVLCGVWLILPAIDSHFFHGKWQPALVLVPLLFIRMIAGIATTPLGPLIIVHRGGAAFGIANSLWAAAEVLGACVFIRVLGPTGLAWSYATVVWIGLWLLMIALRRDTTSLMKDLARDVLLRPSAAWAFSLTLGFSLFARADVPGFNGWPAYFCSFLLILSSYLLEPELRGFLAYVRA
jgi:O-antigen/teichoic acid export membrane protein